MEVDENWQLVRIKGTKKAFLWTYERNGNVCINIKVDPEWRDFWRSTYESVLPGYHQNKEHWNTVILRRQIKTNLYVRAGISKKPELLMQPSIDNCTSTMLTIKDPFTFEFLGLEANRQGFTNGGVCIVRHG